MYRTYDSATQIQGHGHTSKSWDLPFHLCPLHISLTLGMIFIKLHPNVPLSEMVCRTNDSAMQTQGLGHTSRLKNLPLNFMSFKYPQPFVRFSLNITNVPLGDLVCRIHDSAMQTQSLGHTSGHWILLRGYSCPSDCCLVSSPEPKAPGELIGWD